VSAQPKHAALPDEIVPEGLRTYLRWDHRRDEAAADVMREYGLRLPEHREPIRQLAVTRVVWASPTGCEPPRAFVFEPSASAEEGTMSDRERQLWTKYVEQREREQQAKRPCKRSRRPDPIKQAELEQALDDLVSDGRRKAE
jgi:hypothetical protein